MKLKEFFVGTAKLGVAAGFGALCTIHWGATNSQVPIVKSPVPIEASAGIVSKLEIIHTSDMAVANQMRPWVLGGGADKATLKEMSQAGLISPEIMRQRPQVSELKGSGDFDGQIQNLRAKWWKSSLGEVPTTEQWKKIQEDASSRVGFEFMDEGSKEWQGMLSAQMFKNNLTPVGAKRGVGPARMYLAAYEVYTSPDRALVDGFINKESMVPGLNETVAADQELQIKAMFRQVQIDQAGGGATYLEKIRKGEIQIDPTDGTPVIKMKL